MDKKIIWIIDDDMVSQFAMKYKLEQSYPYFQVMDFYSVEEALNAIKDCIKTQINLPDKLLLDLVLPEKNGWHFLKEFAKLQDKIEGLEIYIVSAFSNLNDRRRVKEHTMVKGYFDKPLNNANIDEILK